MNKFRSFLLSTTLMSVTLLNMASAQLTADATAGTVVGAVGSDFTVSSGTITGTNQFHSFTDFSIPTGGSATFLDPGVMIDNVISRVTGGSVSVIDGALISNVPGANFFFINPNGVTFNANASIDVPAGFYISTADELHFANGDILKADGSAGSTFSVAAPEAFGFLGAGAGDIVLNKTSFDLMPGSAFSFVGGSVTGDNVSLRSEGGKAFVAGINDALSIDISGVDAGDHKNASLGDVIFTGGGGIDVQSFDMDFGAAFTLLGRDLIFESDEVRILALDFGGVLTLSTGTSGSAPAAVTNIFASRNIHFLHNAELSANTFASGNVPMVTVYAGNELLLDSVGRTFSLGNGFSVGGLVSDSSETSSGSVGGIDVTAKSIFLREGAQISADARGFGSGGIVNVTADTLTIATRGAITTGAFVAIPGDPILGASPGAININVSDLAVIDGGFIESSSFGVTDAGPIVIDASNSILVDGFNSEGLSIILSDSTGDGAPGSITISSPNIVISNRGTVQTVARGNGRTGPGGSITINSNNFLMNDGLLSARTTGNTSAGSILVEADEIQIVNDSAISASTRGSAVDSPVGAITLSATNILIDASVIAGTTQDVRDGSSINLIATSDIRVTGRTRIRGNTIELAPGDSPFQDSLLQLGDGGLINIRAHNLFLEDNSAIFSLATFLSDGSTSVNGGSAGNILVYVANDLVIIGDPEMLSFSGIASSTQGRGPGGTLEINVGNNLILSDDSLISADSLFDFGGQAGSVIVNVGSALFISDISSITSSAVDGSNGNAGSIIIASPDIVVDSGSIATTATGTGDAGPITLNGVTNLSLLNGGSISTTSAAGAGGDITINFVGSRLIIRNDGFIETAVLSGPGMAGDITINGVDLVIFDDADIRTSADTGGGGAINISAGVIIPNLGILEIVENRTRVFSDPISFIDPSSTSGVSGAVVLGGLEGDVTAGVEELDESFLDASDVLDRRCAGARAAGAPSTLVQDSPAQAGRRPTDVAPAFYGDGHETESSSMSLSQTARARRCAVTLSLR